MDNKEKIINVFKTVENGTFLTTEKINKILTSWGTETVHAATVASLAKQGYLKKADSKLNGRVQYSLAAETKEEALLNTEGFIKTFDELKVKGQNHTVAACQPLLKNTIHFGNIHPDKTHQKLIWDCFYDENQLVVAGLEYFMVIDGYVYRNGKTDNTMDDRIKSYNCGTFENRKRGTCSVTNFQVLQSILSMNKTVEVWVKLAPLAAIELEGQIYQINTSPSRALESIDNNLLKQNHIKLPGCFQQ